MVEDLKIETQKRMKNIVDSLKKDFSSLRTGRANPDILRNVTVEAYGSIVPLAQCASVSIKDSQMLLVSVWDSSLVPFVKKAISDAKLGLNASSEGSLVRIAIPYLTEERRKEITKIAKQFAERARVSIRHIRRDAIGDLKKMDLAEDELRLQQDMVQKLTDKYIKSIDVTLIEKEKDIMQI